MSDGQFYLILYQNGNNHKRGTNINPKNNKKLGLQPYIIHHCSLFDIVNSAMSLQNIQAEVTTSDLYNNLVFYQLSYRP